LRRTARPVVAAAFLAVAAPLSAQPPVIVGIGGGVTIPHADLAVGRRAGYHAAVMLDYRSELLVPLAFRLEAASHRIPGSASSGRAEARIATAAVDVVLYHPAMGVAPYVLGGFGLYRCTNAVVGGTTTARGANIGFGLGAERAAVGLFAEMRFHYVGRGSDPAIIFIPLTAGVTLGPRPRY
jgi:hypothetical protein